MEREIALLSPLKHENVVNVIEVCRTANPLKAGPRFSFALVLDFCAHDLAGLINEISFNLAETKCIMKQVLSALFFIHYQKVGPFSSS